MSAVEVEVDLPEPRGIIRVHGGYERERGSGHAWVERAYSLDGVEIQLTPDEERTAEDAIFEQLRREKEEDCQCP